jgi:hypothetical protein
MCRVLRIYKKTELMKLSTDAERSFMQAGYEIRPNLCHALWLRDPLHGCWIVLEL